MIGIGLGLTMQRGGAGVFSPLSLFANGEAGAWYDPSPDTCFTDTAGTTPAGEGDAVARVNDLSGNGNHATQATVAARPTLEKTAGGLWYLDFDGVDDSLEVDGTSIKDFTLVAGVESGPAKQQVIYSGFVSSSNRVVFYPNDRILGTGGGRLFVNTTNLISEAGVNQTAPQVFTGRSSSGDHYLRRDGASIGTSSSASSADMFPGTIGNFNSEQPLLGKVFSLILREGDLGAILSQTEAYVAAKTGVTL
jgi:hypothetical protein